MKSRQLLLSNLVFLFMFYYNFVWDFYTCNRNLSLATVWSSEGRSRIDNIMNALTDMMMQVIERLHFLCFCLYFI